MTLLPSPLLLLIAMRFRANWRRIVRALRTPKGILIAAGICIVVFFWCLPSILAAFGAAISGRHPTTTTIAGSVAPFGPFIVLGLLLVALIRSPGDQALAFLQAEVDLLFPAPFTRRQLLFYKLAQRVVPLLFVSFFFSLWTQQFAYGWLQAWLGIALTLWFLHLVALCVALLSQMLEKRRFTAWRRLVALALVVVVVGGSWWTSESLTAHNATQNATDMLRAFASSTAGAIVSAPTVPFARVYFARDLWPDVVVWAAVALAINAALLGLAVRLDANWLEAGAESSKKLAQRLDEYRRTGGVSSRGARLSFVRLPMFPRLGGVGPLAWRQTITGIRQGTRGLMIIAIVIAVMIVPQLLKNDAGPNRGASWAVAFKPVSLFLLGYISLMMPQILRLDFRGDTDRMDTLKSLPVSPFAVATSQVLVPATIVTLIQWPLGALLAWLLSWHIDALPLWALVLYAANVAIATVDNCVYLIWPIRPQAGVGMSFVSGQFITQIVKTIAIIVILGIAAGAGGIAGYVGGEDLWSAATAALVVLVIEASIVLFVVGQLFARFDPSRDRVADA